MLQSFIRSWRPVAALSILTLSACDSSTEVGTSARIRMAAPAVVGQSTVAGEGLSITGSNGTLVITDVKMIVNEFELRRTEIDDCDDDDSSGPGSCGSFETEYFIADVPLGAGAVTVANDRIPSGTYTAMEFEVKDLEVDLDDDDDVAESARINALLAQLRTTYANWPAGASMRIEGTFTPTGGVAQPFVAYFDAEIEVEKLFTTPLVIDETSAGVTIDLRLDLWFKNGDGTVRNLALNNCSTTCSLIEFEVEMEDGFEVEFDD
jgi:hypothetical protein